MGYRILVTLALCTGACAGGDAESPREAAADSAAASPSRTAADDPRATRVRAQALSPDVGAAQPFTAFEELVAAERAFASAARSGVSAAFVAALDSSGVVFAPGPVDGRALHTTQPWPSDVELRWHPRVAGVAGSGELGYTTGPWTSGRAGAPGGWGHYVSVWRKTPSGWRVVLDIGISHSALTDQDAAPVSVARFPETLARVGGGGGGGGVTAQLAEASARLRADIARAEAPSRGVAPGVRVYLEGRAPEQGVAALADAVASAGGAWSTAGSGASSASDLAYRYGTFGHGEAAEGNFLELWFGSPRGWELGLLLVQPVSGR